MFCAFISSTVISSASFLVAAISFPPPSLWIYHHIVIAGRVSLCFTFSDISSNRSCIGTTNNRSSVFSCVPVIFFSFVIFGHINLELFFLLPPPQTFGANWLVEVSLETKNDEVWLSQSIKRKHWISFLVRIYFFHYSTFRRHVM